MAYKALEYRQFIITCQTTEPIAPASHEPDSRMKPTPEIKIQQSTLLCNEQLE